MLVLSGGQVESLFDLGLAVGVAELPVDLAALDRLLEDPALLTPIEAAWAAGHRDRGRPSVAMDRFVRLMVVKARSGGWGYETLVREVSDSLHLRRFCRIALTERVPDESTVRKLVKRLGADVIDEITMLVLARASGVGTERRFVARAARIDSTVVESDIRYPTDLGLAQDAARMLAAAGKNTAGLAGHRAPHVTDRSRSISGRLRQLNRSIAGRTGQSKELALRLTGEAGALAARSVREAKRLATVLRQRARGRGAQAKLQAAERIERVADRAAKVCEQITKRVAGEKITDRLVSMSDPDARPIRKGKLRQPTEFGTVMQVAELCENTRRGARGLILPLATQIGSPNEANLLPATGRRLNELSITPREIALDGGFQPGPVAEHLPNPERLFIAGKHAPGSRKTNRRLAKFRVGCEGRISHLKRRYGLRRSRLKGHHGARTTAAWAILAYNLDTLAIRAT
ncbi:MAG: transposase, family [Solirubrobacteraceae bacterium]|nr:transposase, family [Solirubrobacteraceae bacterium]